MVQASSLIRRVPEQAVEDARLPGWEQATAAQVFYSFKDDSDFDRSADDSPLRVVGNFRYRVE